MRLGIIKVLCISLMVFMYYGCNNPCKGFVSKYNIDTALDAFFFKAGTYWVYQDSATQQIDSQQVTSVFQSSSIDSPWVNHPGVYDCGPVYNAYYSMRINETSGSAVDSIFINIFGSSIAIEYYSSESDTTAYVYDDNKESHPPCVSYVATYNSLKISNTLFYNVAQFRNNIDSLCPNYFGTTVDFFSSPNFGVVKKVEYNAMGQPIHSWDLIKCNIVQ